MTLAPTLTPAADLAHLSYPAACMSPGGATQFQALTAIKNFIGTAPKGPKQRHSEFISSIDAALGRRSEECLAQIVNFIRLLRYEFDGGMGWTYKEKTSVVGALFAISPLPTDGAGTSSNVVGCSEDDNHSITRKVISTSHNLAPLYAPSPTTDFVLALAKSTFDTWLPDGERDFRVQLLRAYLNGKDPSMCTVPGARETVRRVLSLYETDHGEARCLAQNLTSKFGPPAVGAWSTLISATADPCHGDLLRIVSTALALDDDTAYLRWKTLAERGAVDFPAQVLLPIVGARKESTVTRAALVGQLYASLLVRMQKRDLCLRESTEYYAHDLLHALHFIVGDLTKENQPLEHTRRCLTRFVLNRAKFELLESSHRNSQVELGYELFSAVHETPQTPPVLRGLWPLSDVGGRLVRSFTIRTATEIARLLGSTSV
jgi:hypothetical protein